MSEKSDNTVEEMVNDSAETVKENEDITKKGNKKKGFKKKQKNTESEKLKKLYLRLFFYSFCGTFIIGGLIVLLIFINVKDPDLLGASKKYYEQALQYYNNGDFDAAEGLLIKCVDKDKENADALILLADIYHNDNKSEEAINLLLDSINSGGMNEKNDALYKKVIQIYTDLNQIEQAYDFINGVDSYIRQRLSGERPTIPSVSPAQGSYDAAITVTVDVPDGCTVYYTLDGTLPTKESNVYIPDESVIEITHGATVFRAFAINEIGLLSDETVLRYTVYNENSEYEFKDEKMEAIVRANIGKSSGSVLFKDVASVESLSNSLSSISSSSKIKTLEDLSVMTSLTELSLSGETSIEDFSVLQTVTSLKSLTLSDCNISGKNLDTVLSLKTVSYLNISGNGISDISKISSMASLTSLDVSNNLITDLSALSGASGLASLNVSKNGLSSLSSLPENSALTELNTSLNEQLVNLSGIEKLKNLQTLDISDTSVSSIKDLTANSRLINLKLCNTPVTDLSPLSELSSLSTLDISYTSIQDLSPLGVTYLKALTAKRANITDLSSLAGITVESLDISDNPFTDISPLAGLSRLKFIDVSRTGVNNLETLAGCLSLSEIACEGVSVSGTAMSVLINKGIKVVN